MNTIDEIWKDIPGYEGYYKVSNLGRVKSLKRTHKKPHPRTKSAVEYTVPERILTQSNSHCGGIRRVKKPYKVVSLSRYNNKKTCSTHRLVAAAFLANPKNKEQVNHINGDTIDNRLSNLEWVTNSENQIHAIQSGLKGDYSWIKKGSENRRSKPVNQLTKDGQFVARFDNARVAADILNLHRSAIYSCCNKKKHFKTHGGFKWEWA